MGCPGKLTCCVIGIRPDGKSGDMTQRGALPEGLCGPSKWGMHSGMVDLCFQVFLGYSPLLHNHIDVCENITVAGKL